MEFDTKNTLYILMRVRLYSFLFMHMYKRAWFTLVELMIVIAIISVLVAALYPNLQRYLSRARDAETRAKVTQVAGALENYMIDKGTWLIPWTLGGGTWAIDYNPSLASFSPVQSAFAAGEPSVIGVLAEGGYLDRTTIREVNDIEDSRYTLSACTLSAFTVSAKVNFPSNTDTSEKEYGCNIPSVNNTAMTRWECLSWRSSGQNCLGQVIWAGPTCGNGASDYPTCVTPPNWYCWVYIISNGGWYDWGSSMSYLPGYILLSVSGSYTDPGTSTMLWCGISGSN